ARDVRARWFMADDPTTSASDPNPSTLQRITRLALGAGLLFAGIGHLTFLRQEFRAQVPDWVPLPVDATVVYSGVAEVALGTALMLTDKAPRRQALGCFTA